MMKIYSFDGVMRAAAPSRRAGKSSAALAAVLLAGTALAGPAWADDKPAAADDDSKKEIVVTGSLGALPLKDVGSVFGFDKTIAETPRSASTISSEQLERFGVNKIYDLVTQSPGVFSSSYFGTGGALEIRGTPGEVYFRGMLRLENGGNYPTPIGAADRIDIVRGPASPIYGPSKTGGYMNFVPKTARAENGTYASETTGDLEADVGEWGYKVLKGSITGPGKIGDHAFGYSLYGEVEDSDSYYRYVNTRDTLFSAAFDTDITPSLRTEFGGMYQNFKGQQNSGWNRITQQLIDNGTYITGNAANNLDGIVDGIRDGKLSREEVYAANRGLGLTTFGSYDCGVFNNGPTGYTPSCLTSTLPDLALQNPGTTTLSRRDVLTGPDDKLNNIQKTAYFDLIWDGPKNLEIKNQLFYDDTDNLNENLYGFSQFIKSYVIEDKIVISDKFNLPGVTIAAQTSPSLRYTNFFFGDDYGAEFWNRPDLTTGYVPASSRLLSTECGCDYSDYIRGHYLDTGIAGLVDVTFDFGLDVLGGIRYDHVHAVSGGIQSMYDPVSYGNNEDAAGNFITHASRSQGGVSWNASISYKTPFGLIPYFTASHQTTVVVGEGAEIEPTSVLSGFMAASKMMEVGIKGEFLNKRLYIAVDAYKQQRTDAAAESSLTNQVVKTKGVEAEVRWSVDRHFLITGNYTYIQVIDQSALAGNFFNYFGIGDLVNVPQSLAYLYLGGSQIGLISPATKQLAERPGIPHNVVSATATYAFDNGIALNGDIQHVDHTYSGYTQQVRLPAYWLLNLGASYKTGPWLFSVNIKNVNNARYFRAGGQDLFGADIVLPELPRSWQASIKYKF